MKTKNKGILKRIKSISISKRLYFVDLLIIVVPLITVIACVLSYFRETALPTDNTFSYAIRQIRLAAINTDSLKNFLVAVTDQLNISLLTCGFLFSMLIILLVGIVYFLISHAVFKSIRKRITLLSKGVNEIHEGNLDYRIKYSSEDEFRDICNDFDDMAVRLQKSVENAQLQDASRRELFASISHDIRSPLTSIMAYSEGLLGGIATDDETRRHYYSIINDKANDIERMTSQLMYLSKVEMGDMNEHPERISLDKFIKDYVKCNAEIYADKNMIINTTEIEEVNIMADYGFLNRIFTNIIENSVKYMNREQGHFDINLIKLKNYCCLSFSDDGPGVSNDAIDHIFDVFYRSDSARQNTNNGNGLGLSIVANIVKRMNGYVLADNISTGGLKITIKLPMIKDSEQHG